MRSMTGYGWAEEQAGDLFASAEIKGYNNRFLDIVISLPPFLSALEVPVREFLAARCRRGRLEVSLRYRENNAPFIVSVNREAALAYRTAAEETARLLGIDERLTLSTILSMEGVLETERRASPQKALERIMPLLEKAFAGFDGDRQREGEHTRRDIMTHAAALEKSRGIVASHSGELEAILRENVRSRFAELLGSAVDENRVYAETASLLVKYTIAEELSRLAAHLAAFHAGSEEESPGKKLDFLCQEINREINTIGSKSAVLEISREVVNMKDALENIREQLRNVE